MDLDFAAVLTDGPEKDEIVNAEYVRPAEVLAPVPILSLDAVRPQFARYLAEVDKMVADAQAVSVKDEESLKFAVALGGQAKKIAKAIEAQEDLVTAEAKDYVKSVRGFVTSFTERLVSNAKKSNGDCIEAVLKKKIGYYQHKIELERREQERRAQEAAAELRRKLEAEAEEANRKAREEAMRKAEEEARAKAASQAEIEAARKKAEEEAKAHEIAAPVVPDPIMPQAEGVIHTDTGASAHFRVTWKAEVLDESLVPRSFCSPDMRKINDAVKMGTRTMPGVRIWEDKQPVLRS